MKKQLLLLASLFFIVNLSFGQQGMGIGNNNPQEMLDVTGAIKVGTNTTGNPSTAPAGGVGTMRFNSSTNVFEGWDGSAWVTFGGGGSSSGDKFATIRYTQQIYYSNQWYRVNSIVNESTDSPISSIGPDYFTVDETGKYLITTSFGVKNPSYTHGHNFRIQMTWDYATALYDDWPRPGSLTRFTHTHIVQLNAGTPYRIRCLYTNSQLRDNPTITILKLDQ